MTSTEQLIERYIATLTSLGGKAGNQRLLEALEQQLIEDGRIGPGEGEAVRLPC